METIKNFMIEQLSELYDAKIQLKMILDKIAYQTNNEDLRHSFEIASKKSEHQVEMIDKIFSMLGAEREQRTAQVMEGIANDVQAFTEKSMTPETVDAGFIALVQKAKHYEIALYGTLRDYANQSGQKQAEQMLTEMLEEEKANDQYLTEMARGGINQRAVDATAVPRRFATTGIHKKTNTD